MSKTASKPVQLTVGIECGPVSPAAKAAWCRFWRRLIAEVKNNER